MNNVEMVKVDSSNIKAVGYQNGDLYVEYGNGIYKYVGVPKNLFEGLVGANSKGKYMNEEIKGKFAHTKENVELNVVDKVVDE